MLQRGRLPGSAEGEEYGVHVEIVTALDAHLAELQTLRGKLTDARVIERGERLDVVVRIAASAERLIDTVHVHHPHPPALTDGAR